MLIKSLLLKKNNYFVLFILFILLIRIFFLFFSNIELQGDEAQYWYWSTHVDWGYYSKPPFVAWVLSIFTYFFGNSTFVIKLPSLLVHFMTTVSLFYLSKSFDKSDEESFWLATSYFLFFAVTFSSNLISTDPFLLLFWSLSLLFLNKLHKDKSAKYIFLTGFSVALGFYAKYAMVYFFLCSPIYGLFVSEKKKYYKNLLYISLITFIFLLPHIIWVYDQDGVTLSHTRDNFNWSSNLFNFNHLLNFIIGQFFISTPIFFYFYIKSLTKFKETLREYSYEVSFSFPIILLVTLQSFISRANANWASMAFIGIAMIVTNMLFNRYKKILVINSIFSFLVLILISFTIIFPPNISPFNKLKGMKNAAKEIEFLDKSLQVKYIVFDDRMTISKFLYYLPSKESKMKIIQNSKKVDNHFEMIMPIVPNLLMNQKIIYIHKQKKIQPILRNKVLVQQFFEMPNKTNSFYISYLE